MAELTPWLVMRALTAKGRVAPLVASSAPTPVALVPLRESKRPETTTWLGPARTIDMTSLLVWAFCSGLFGRRLPAVDPTPGWGAHDRSAPSVARTAASLLRAVLPTAEKRPPR